MGICFLKINIALVILFGFYKLMFSSDTFFSWKRAALMGMYVVAVLVPGLNCSYWLNKSVGVVSMANEYADIILPIVTITPGDNGSFDWEAVAMTAYSMVVAVLLLRLLWQLSAIVLLKRKCRKAEVCGVNVCLLEGDEGPFSFFHWIFLNPMRHSQLELDEIIAHERAHCRQLHSLDILFAELFAIVFWGNPFAWLLKREVRLNLEFLADNNVLAGGRDSKEYQYHLLGLAYRKNVATISNNFNVLPLKKRIKMMNKKRTNGVAKAKYVLYVPLAVMLLAVSNIEIVAREIASATTNGSVTAVSVNRQVSKPLMIQKEKPMAVEMGNADLPVGKEEKSETEDVVPLTAEAEVPAVENDEAATEASEEEQADQKQKEGDRKVYTVSEEMPSFNGSVNTWLVQNMKYPVDAARNKEQGTVIVKFIITAQGEVKDPVIVRSISPSLDKEALRVVSVMPKWNPGKNKGKSVDVYYCIPIRFKLN